MGATTGARLPLAGQQARVNQLLSAEKSASALSSERAAIRQQTKADAAASAARDAEAYAAANRAASAARDAETSRRTGAPLTQTPPGGYEDSFDPAQLNRAKMSRRPSPFNRQR